MPMPYFLYNSGLTIFLIISLAACTGRSNRNINVAPSPCKPGETLGPNGTTCVSAKPDKNGDFKNGYDDLPKFDPKDYEKNPLDPSKSEPDIDTDPLNGQLNPLDPPPVGNNEPPPSTDPPIGGPTDTPIQPNGDAGNTNAFPNPFDLPKNNDIGAGGVQDPPGGPQNSPDTPSITSNDPGTPDQPGSFNNTIQDNGNDPISTIQDNGNNPISTLPGTPDGPKIKLKLDSATAAYSIQFATVEGVSDARYEASVSFKTINEADLATTTSTRIALTSAPPTITVRYKLEQNGSIKDCAVEFTAITPGREDERQALCVSNQ